MNQADSSFILPKPIFIGISGHTLTDDERALIQEMQPLGFHIFRRNIASKPQLAELIAELTSLVHHQPVPIGIDQEGGQVMRLRPPLFWKMPPAGEFGDLYATLPDVASTLVYDHGKLVGYALKQLGINMNYAPVLDLLHPGAHQVIGDRSFGSDPVAVTHLAKQFADGMLSQGVMPTFKHLPGHGRAEVDSHVHLPTIHASLEELYTTDFYPFEQLKHYPVMMAAHIITPIDPGVPVTFSASSMHYFREVMGIESLIISDGIEMGALSGTIEERVQKALAAGCDIVLHCNAKLEEMREVHHATIPMTIDQWEHFTTLWSTWSHTSNDPDFDFESLFQHVMQQFQHYGLLDGDSTCQLHEALYV